MEKTYHSGSKFYNRFPEELKVLKLEKITKNLKTILTSKLSFSLNNKNSLNSYILFQIQFCIFTQMKRITKKILEHFKSKTFS